MSITVADARLAEILTILSGCVVTFEQLPTVRFLDNASDAMKVSSPVKNVVL